MASRIRMGKKQISKLLKINNTYIETDRTIIKMGQNKVSKYKETRRIQGFKISSKEKKEWQISSGTKIRLTASDLLPRLSYKRRKHRKNRTWSVSTPERNIWIWISCIKNDQCKPMIFYFSYACSREGLLYHFFSYRSAMSISSSFSF